MIHLRRAEPIDAESLAQNSALDCAKDMAKPAAPVFVDNYASASASASGSADGKAESMFNRIVKEPFRRRLRLRLGDSLAAQARSAVRHHRSQRQAYREICQKGEASTHGARTDGNERQEQQLVLRCHHLT
jgi:hypothetical protein